MESIKIDTTLKEYQDFIQKVYGLPNDRYFDTWDMLNNLWRFSMRGMKGIRKNDKEKATNNFIIALSWFMSIMNQLHIDIEQETWERFPFLCSYCASYPCSCKKKKVKERQKVVIDDTKRTKTLQESQDMFQGLYPKEDRTLEHAGIHLSEELGEFSETMLKYRGNHNDTDFEKVTMEAADVISCFIGVFNSLSVNLAEELSKQFSNNCHICHDAPCSCNFTFITEFKS